MNLQPSSMGRLLFLPLPPSTNARQIPVVRGGHALLVNTRETNKYLDVVGLWLRCWTKARGYQAVVKHTYFDFWFVLPRVGCDPHNYFKVSCDALERGGIVTDDRYALVRIQGLWHDAKAPEIVVKV